MALQYSTTVQAAKLDAVETTIGTAPSLIIYSGAAAANCAAADPTGALVTITLPSDWMAAASSNTKGITGSPWSGTASGTGTPASFRIKQGATCHLQGSAGVGSGDLNLNGSITSGQTVNITAFTLTGANT